VLSNDVFLISDQTLEYLAGTLLLQASPIVYTEVSCNKCFTVPIFILYNCELYCNEIMLQEQVCTSVKFVTRQDKTRQW